MVAAGMTSDLAAEILASTDLDFDLRRWGRFRADIAAALPGLIARVAELERENFALAADQCHAGYGDDWGNHCCKEQDELRAQITALEAGKTRSPFTGKR